MSTSNSFMKASLWLGGFIALLLGCYRLASIAIYGCSPEVYVFANHMSAILGMWILAGWCFTYHHIRFSDTQKSSDLKIMKIVSLSCSILCLVRVITATIYFSERLSENPSVITFSYIAGDLLLWAVLSVFFFCYWLHARKHGSHSHEHHHHHHHHTTAA